MIEPIPVPWKVGRSRQEEGLVTEAKIAKKRGARVHPRSGAGRIKDDASSEDFILEIKDANKTHTLKAADLDALFRRAVSQGKTPQYVIYFQSVDLTATIEFKRGMR